MELQNQITMQSILSKKKNKIACEDFIGTFDNVYWILDGASVPDNLKIKDTFDSCWYVRSLSKGIINALHKYHQSTSLSQILAEAISDVSMPLLPHFNEPDFEYYLPSCTIVMIRFTNQYLEYLVLGDSYLVVSNYDCHVVTDNRLLQIESEHRQAILDLLQSGVGYDSQCLKEKKHKVLTQEIIARNKDGGFWIASNESKAVEHAITGRIDLNSEDGCFLLMTDGMATAVTELNIFDSWDSLLQFIQSNGLEECIRLIRSVEESDPTGQKYPRFSWSDDASALYIRSSSQSEKG
jgi:hypothetical protein